jgi:hypothetical protein
MDWFVSWILIPAIPLSFLILSFKMGHTRFMNAFRRFAAYWFVCLGTLAVVGTIAAIVWPSSVEESQASIGTQLSIIIVFGLVVVVGLLMLRMPSYRPDLGDTMRFMSTEPWSEELARRQGRSPWTGDPRPTSTGVPPSQPRAI